MKLGLDESFLVESAYIADLKEGRSLAAFD